MFEMEQILLNGSHSKQMKNLPGPIEFETRRPNDPTSVEVSDFSLGERYYDFNPNPGRKNEEHVPAHKSLGYQRREESAQQRSYATEYLDETSPDAVYASLRIPLSKKASLLKTMKAYIQQLQSYTHDYDRKIDEKLRLIFGQRLAEAPGPNCLTIAELEQMARCYRTQGSLPRSYFKNSKDALPNEVFVIEMEQLMRLVEERPPGAEPNDRRGTFNFMLWHIQRLYQPQRIELMQDGSTRGKPSGTPTIYEDRNTTAYYFLPGQVNCECNIEETFLFLLISTPPKRSIDITDRLEGIIARSTRY